MLFLIFTILKVAA